MLLSVEEEEEVFHNVKSIEFVVNWPHKIFFLEIRGQQCNLCYFSFQSGFPIGKISTNKVSHGILMNFNV